MRQHDAGLAHTAHSVDHGTALSLARSGQADAGSLRAALALAVEIGRHKSRTCRSVSDSDSISCMIPG